MHITVIDVEITGVVATSHGVIEIAPVRVRPSTGSPAVPRLLYRRLVRPRVPIGPLASAVHHLTEADLAGAPDPAVRRRHRRHDARPRTPTGPVRRARRRDRLGPPGGLARGNHRVGGSGDTRPVVADDPTLRAASPVRAGIPGDLRVRRCRRRQPRRASHHQANHTGRLSTIA